MMIVPTINLLDATTLVKVVSHVEIRRVFVFKEMAAKLPYDNRILLYRKPMIYECGESCSCPAGLQEQPISKRFETPVGSVQDGELRLGVTLVGAHTSRDFYLRVGWHS
ncbi:unnamed protein product [Brassica napus]|uniref:(rape) hypothetical protein n=1 Tax=Brassica napus TaxID=3708 RepID=A0A816S551_BRANA|nr:unnamed protein product [Brassica napus]